MQEAFRNHREMEWNSALAGRDEARPLPVHHSREQRTGRCGHRPLRRRSRLAVRRMAGAREETGERHAGSSCPTGESPGRDAPSWFPALALERIEIIFRRGVYVAKNTSQAASVENGRPNGAAILCAQSACAFIRPRQLCCLGRGNLSLKCSSVHFSETQFRIYTLQSLRPKLMHSA